MAAKLLVTLAFLITKVSCGQNSLTFVIDNSPSMGYEISAVKNTAKSIIDIILNEKSSQIEDIVLVTFRNYYELPEDNVVLRKKTRDEGELKLALDSINIETAFCYEVALTAMKKGLEESRQGSYMFVFSDTSSEDYQKFAEVRTLCQQKQTQVFIILTDFSTCVDEESEYYRVYYKIAKECGGHVFKIVKNELNQVLDFVKDTIKGEEAEIETRTIAASKYWEDIDFNVDDNTEKVVVSASGSNVELQIHNSSHQIFGKRIMWTSNVKITSLTNVQPGLYTAKVRGQSEVTIKVVGRTDFQFQHGFSATVQTDLNATDIQPTTAIKTLLMVSVQDKTHSLLIREVELLDMNDRVLMRLPLTKVVGDIYKTDMFMSPEQTFRISIIAVTNKDAILKRIAQTPVKPIQSVKPRIENLAPTMSVMENTTNTLHCKVTGFPKPAVNWFYKGPHSTDYEIISKSDSYVFKHIKLSDAGHYKCTAESVVGRTEATVEVTVNAPPRIVFVPPNSPEYSGVEGDVVMRLQCASVGYPTPTTTWVVHNHVIGYDQSKELYVKNTDLFLRNPKERHSYNATTRTYVCHAKNAFGEATQPYDVYISKYVDSDNASGTIYFDKEHPHNFACPLPFTDPNSVRWFENHTLVLSGPTIQLQNSGNYTCRVSDFTGATSYTIEVIFGSPPKRQRTSYQIKWSGEQKILSCYSNESPSGKYSWFYNGKPILGENTVSLQPIGWGQYTCQNTHPLGNLSLNFQVVTNKNECGILTSFLKSYHAPLVLDSNQTWPTLPTIGQYLNVPNSKQLQLICQDEKSPTQNSFTKHPTSKTINATCDKEDYFLVNGISQKIPELNCKTTVTPSIIKTGRPCLGENSELIQIGFHVNGFREIYQSCVDSIKNVPLYTKMETIVVKKSSEASLAKKNNCKQECCYEKVQLVNSADVSVGPAEKATLIDAFNSVNYCKPRNENDTNWHDIENISRERSGTEQFIVWSGAVNYSKVAGAWTPKYLWKVMKTKDSSEMVVVHENTATAGPKLCAGSCGEDFVWLEPAGDRTYCCSLEDFKKALSLSIDFN